MCAGPYPAGRNGARTKKKNFLLGAAWAPRTGRRAMITRFAQHRVAANLTMIMKDGRIHSRKAAGGAAGAAAVPNWLAAQ